MHKNLTDLSLLDSMASAARIVFLRIDLVTGLITSNRLFQERWGYENASEVHYADHLNRMSPGGRAIFERALEEVPRSKEPYQELMQSPSLENTWHKFLFTPVFNEDRTVWAIDVTNIDVTDEITAKKQLEQSNAELERLLERQKEMFSIVGHELRTPCSGDKDVSQRYLRGA